MVGCQNAQFHLLVSNQQVSETIEPTVLAKYPAFSGSLALGNPFQVCLQAMNLGLLILHCCAFFGH